MKLTFEEMKELAAVYNFQRPILTSVVALKYYDQDRDLSYLEYGDTEYAEQDRERLESYGVTWHMIGIQVKAKFVVPLQDGNFQVNHTLTSAGLWGIESDSDSSYFEEVAQEEWQELKRQLEMMNIVIPDNIEIEWED